MKKKKKYIIFFLLLVEITSVFFMFKSYGNKTLDMPVEGTTERINKVVKQKYSMWKRTSTTSDTYEEISVIPDGLYRLNPTRTNCVDMDGNSVNYIPTYHNGKVTVTSTQTIFCWLYFDNYFDGEGTELNPYQIKIIENLVDLSILTNDGNNFENTYFAMTKSLDFLSTSSYGDSTRIDYGDINGDSLTEGLLIELTKNTGTGFTPIGVKNDKIFHGNFDGNNYTLSNMYINGNRTTGYREGLFGTISGSEIKNLTVTGTIVRNGSDSAGGIVGGAAGTSLINNCTNEVNVSSSTTGGIVGGIVAGVTSDTDDLSIINCTNKGILSGFSTVGGVVGYNGGSLSIQNSHNEADLTSNLGTVKGGLMGGDASTLTTSTIITNSYNDGIITNGSNSATGGLIGFVLGNASIDNCYNNKQISNPTGNYAGGLIGQAGGSSTINIANSHNNGNVSGALSSAGGLIGTSNGATSITDSYNAGKVINSIGRYAGGLIGKDYSVTSNTTIKDSYNTGEIKANIDDASLGNAGGLMGVLVSAANVDNFYNTGDVGTDIIDVNSYKYIGGLIGSAGPNSTLILSNSHNSGPILNGSRTGGFIGIAQGRTIIDNCYNSANITSASNKASGGTNVGGIIGHVWQALNKVIVLNTYNSGSVSCTSTVSCSANGIIGDTGSDSNDKRSSLYLINIYNVGNISTTFSARGIGRCNSYSDCVINNVYNYGTISGTGTSKYSFFQNGNSSLATVTVNNGYYINTATGTSGTITGTPVSMSSSEFNTQSFATTLNNNLTGINLSTFDSELSGYGLLSWKLDSTKGYPVFSDQAFVTIEATKKTSGTTVATDTWSNEGLNFTLSAPAGATIYYCKDTANTCSPGTTATSGNTITSYNTTTGTYYIRYKTVSNGVSSAIKTYIAKVDTTSPDVVVDLNTTTISATLTDSGSGVDAYSFTNSTTSPTTYDYTFTATSSKSITKSYTLSTTAVAYQLHYKDAAGNKRRQYIYARKKYVAIGDSFTQASTSNDTVTCSSSNTTAVSCAMSGSAGNWTATITALASGTSNVKVKYSNSSVVYYYSVTVDASGPTIINDYDGTKIVSTITDTASGVVAYSVTTTNAEPTTWDDTFTAASPVTKSTTLASGSRYVQAKDAVGNRSTKWINISSATIAKNGTSTLTSSGTSALTCESSNTSVATCAVSGSSGAWTYTITGVAAGNAAIKLRSSDNNVPYYRSITVDAAAPTINITHTGTAIGGTITDNVSGVVAYSITDSSTAPSTYDNTFTATTTKEMSSTAHTSGSKYVHVKDAVGNHAVYSIGYGTINTKKGETNTATLGWSGTPTCATKNSAIATCAVSGSSGSWTITATGVKGGSTYFTLSLSSSGVRYVFKVNVYEAPSTPTITASDSITSGNWHTANFTLSFSGSSITNGSGNVTYYYGTSTSSMTSTGATTGTISTATTSTTYYVKACNSSYTSACSSNASYVVKLDKTGPTIINDYDGSKIVSTITDNGSKVVAYSVTSSNAAPSTWDSTFTAASPVTKSTTVASGSKYVQAKDAVGNRSTKWINISSATIAKNETSTISDTGTANLTCESTNTSVATCARSGQAGGWTFTITGVAGGSAGIKIKDGDGNVKWYRGITVDATAPTIILDYNGTNITGTITDSGSGVVADEITSSSAAPSTWSNTYTATSSKTVSYAVASGSRYVQAKDAVGNRGSRWINISSASIAKNATSVISSTSTVTNLTCTSSNTSIATCAITGSAGDYTFTITGKAEGTAAIKVKLSNGSVMYYRSITVDSTAPGISVNHTGSAFTATLTDSGSKLAAYAITTTSTAPASSSSDWIAISGSPSSYTTPSTAHTSGYKYVYAKDKAGNVSGYTLWVASRYYGKNEAWSNTSTTTATTFTCTSSNTSIATCGVSGSSGNWTYSITGKTSNGTSLIKFNVGTKTQWIYNATVDVTAPTITITHNGTNLAGTITDSSSKVAAYAITSSSATPSSWTTVTAATSVNIPSTAHTSGTKYVHAKDSVGNATYESVTYTSGYIKNGATTQIFGYSGSTASCESTSTSIATCAMGGSSGAWTVNATGKATGTTYIKLKVGSQATVRQIKATTVINAPTAPTITASDGKANNVWHNANFTLTFSGSSLPGNGQVVYYYGTSSSSMTSTGTSVSISSETKSTTYYVKACNSLETSFCSSTVNYTYKLDKTGPSVSITAKVGTSTYSGGWTKGPVNITMSMTDTIATVDTSTIQWKVTGGSYASATTCKNNASAITNGYSCTDSWTGEYDTTAYYKVCNAAGKCSESSFTLKIDKTPPTASFSLSGSTVTVTCSDAHTPTGGKTVTLSTSPTTVSGTCSDAASNTTPYSKTYTYSRVSSCGVQTAAVCTKSCVVTDYVSRTSRNMFVCTTNSSGTCSGTAVSSAATSTCNSVYGTRGSYNTGSNTDIYVTCNNACPSGYGPSTYADQCEKNRTTTCSCTQGTSGCTCTDPVYYQCWHT